MEFTFTGTGDVKARIQRAVRELPHAVASALYSEAQTIREVSMQRTPVLTGALRASHAVRGPFFGADEVSVDIAVGGPAAPYAIFVHENLAAHHDVGQAKFLESALLEAKPTLAQNVLDRIDMSKVVG